MRRPENIREVAALRPDYMGFIFYEKSPRYVGVDFQVPEHDRSVKRVAVFVDEKEESMRKRGSSLGAHAVQLHGSETPAVCGNLRAAGFEVIKAFSVDDGFNFDSLLPYENLVDYFLFDTKGKHPGGNAKSFDWKLLQNYHQRVPFFLSGGLNKDNVQNLAELAGMNLHALDVNSGVESSPGIKNPVDVEVMKGIVTAYNRK